MPEPARVDIASDEFMPRKITVLLVDDHALVRRGFRRMLEDDPEISVVAEASDGLPVLILQKPRTEVVTVDDQFLADASESLRFDQRILVATDDPPAGASPLHA